MPKDHDNHRRKPTNDIKRKNKQTESTQATNQAKAITKTRLFKYIENFITTKGKISDKKISNIFRISALIIDCGFSLEPPRRGGSNEYSQYMF